MASWISRSEAQSYKLSDLGNELVAAIAWQPEHAYTRLPDVICIDRNPLIDDVTFSVFRCQANSFELEEVEAYDINDDYLPYEFPGELGPIVTKGMVNGYLIGEVDINNVWEYETVTRGDLTGLRHALVTLGWSDASWTTWQDVVAALPDSFSATG